MVMTIGDFGQGGNAGSAAQCALVLEDNPVGEDSRLPFESFQQEIEETYTVQPYREIGADRAPQPAFVAYRGGNWGPFNLKLNFRAGTKLSPAPSAVDNLNLTDVESVLLENERKIRWCQALTFPLPRALGASESDRIVNYPVTGGSKSPLVPTAALTEAVNNVQRTDPPIVLVVFGSWHVIRGYVMNCVIAWGAPWHPVSARPYGATVSLSIQPVYAKYPTWSLIRNLATQGGLTTNTPEISGRVVPPSLADARARAAQRAIDNAGALAGVPRSTTAGIVGG